jgi:hypothetical protein
MPRHFRIHPAIGIARMGNSTGHFIGTETPGVPSNWNDEKETFNTFRDPEEKILRQGACFHVFEYDEDASGALSNPREVTVGGEILDIEWRVHLANRKASFFQFSGQAGADDLYVERSKSLSSAKLDDDHLNGRNPDSLNVLDAARTARLDIDPGEQLISQRSHPGPVELSNPNTTLIPIRSLGTLLLDERGRVVVLGGYGESNSTDPDHNPIQDYANNDTWFDDASDGSVKARIILKDGPIDADPAWVTVAPPDFAPGIGNVVSLHDTLWDTAVREVEYRTAPPQTPTITLLLQQKKAWQNSSNKFLPDFTPLFARDIYSLLKRALGSRDVHVSGTSAEATKHPNFHKISMSDWTLLATLEGDKATDATEMRQYIFNQWVRNPNSDKVEWEKMPRGFGDDYTSLDNGSPTAKSFLSLTRVQYAMLEQWANGNFSNEDWTGQEPTFKSNPNPSPDDLDRAGVENCVGGPFYPGIEVSWLIRAKTLFSEPLRLNVPREPEAEAVAEPMKIGALTFRPGFFSQQMALPWQADFYDCHQERKEGPPGRTEYFFMWWTAQRPDNVFLSGNTKRDRWVREFDKHAKDPANPDALDNFERFNQMQKNWATLKFISAKNADHYEEEPDFNAT